MWVETSHSDRTSFASTEKFLRVVRPPLAVHLVEFAHAGHSVLLWAGLVPEAVRRLGRGPGVPAGNLDRLRPARSGRRHRASGGD